MWAENAAVYFAWRMHSNDSAYLAWDKFAIEVYDEYDNRIAFSEVFNNDPRQNAWYTARLPISSISNYKGQNISVWIGAATDGSLYTYWWVDKVWLSFGCGSQITALQDYEELVSAEEGVTPSLREYLNSRQGNAVLLATPVSRLEE